MGSLISARRFFYPSCCQEILTPRSRPSPPRSRRAGCAAVHRLARSGEHRHGHAEIFSDYRSRVILCRPARGSRPKGSLRPGAVSRVSHPFKAVSSRIHFNAQLAVRLRRTPCYLDRGSCPNPSNGAGPASQKREKRVASFPGASPRGVRTNRASTTQPKDAGRFGRFRHFRNRNLPHAASIRFVLDPRR